MAVVLVPLLLGATVVKASGTVVPAPMWIVLVLRVMGVGDMLRLRRFTLTGRVAELLLVVVQLVALVGAATSLAALLAVLSAADDGDEMAILVERADIDLVMTLVVVVVLLLELLLLECSTLLLVNVEC